jgi:hypothetical protein
LTWILLLGVIQTFGKGFKAKDAKKNQLIGKKAYNTSFIIYRSQESGFRSQESEALYGRAVKIEKRLFFHGADESPATERKSGSASNS